MLLNPNLILRPAIQADWPAIEALLTANKLPLDGARAHLHTFLLALSNGEVVGTAGAEVHGDTALLRSVAVAPGLHRRGIGHALVSRLLREAAARGMGSIHLLTVTAPEYFAQFGFKRGPLDQAPPALGDSAELQAACPACAAFMSLALLEDSAPQHELPVAVIGAGPVGLAAAARLIERGIEPLVLEAGAVVGANLLDYGHVKLFSPWKYNIDAAMAAQLAASGWHAPPADGLPLAGEVVELVLKPFAALPVVARALRLNSRVTAISREGFDKVKTAGRDAAAFVIRAVQNGLPVELRARAVIDASGTWRAPNPLGADGLPAQGEHEHAVSIFYGIPDILGSHRQRYAGKRTLVVGAGHSAANTLLALAELARIEPQTRLVWAVRSPDLTRVFGGGEADALPARGQLGTALRSLRDSGQMELVSGLRIGAIRREGARLTLDSRGPLGQAKQITDIDEIVCATGQRPDLTLTTELRLKLDPWIESTEALGPLIDPNLHSCGTVRPHGHRELSHPEKGFYTVGVKSYGRAPTFLMATGYEQARSVVAAIAGDLQAADRVELDLPETGVCGVGVVDPADANTACCGSPGIDPVNAIGPGIAAVPARATGCGTAACSLPAIPAPVERAAPARPAKCCG